MLHPRASKLLHRIGYVCTAIVAIEILLLSGLFLYGWLEHHRAQSELLNQTRTHEGPLLSHGKYDVASFAISLLALLPPRTTFGKGGLRFVAIPGLGWHYYAISLLDNGEQIEGRAVTVEHAGEGFKSPIRTKFAVSRSAYTQLMEKLNALSDGYAGDTVQCLDGVEIAFEIIRNSQTTSGSGNVCIKHYEQIGDAVLALVQQSAKLPYPPDKSTWGSPRSDGQKEH